MNQIKEEWILWYHSINDNNWNKNSYQKIHEIKDLYDYQYIHNQKVRGVGIGVVEVVVGGEIGNDSGGNVVATRGWSFPMSSLDRDQIRDLGRSNLDCTKQA